MRERTAETKYTLSVNIPISLYQKLVNKTGRGKIGTFIREVLEEKLITEEQNQKEQLKQQLIKGYQAQAKNKKLQKELKAMEETQFEDLKDE
jgi:cell shape-determining protein MreC